ASSAVRTVPAPTIRSCRSENSSTRSRAPGMVSVNSTIRKPPRTAASMAERAVSRAGHLRIAEARASRRRAAKRSGFMRGPFNHRIPGDESTREDSLPTSFKRRAGLDPVLRRSLAGWSTALSLSLLASGAAGPVLQAQTVAPADDAFHYSSWVGGPYDA